MSHLGHIRQASEEGLQRSRQLRMHSGRQGVASTAAALCGRAARLRGWVYAADDAWWEGLPQIKQMELPGQGQGAARAAVHPLYCLQ